MRGVNEAGGHGGDDFVGGDCGWWCILVVIVSGDCGWWYMVIMIGNMVSVVVGTWWW